MGKKKKKDKEESVIWCFYCDRVFQDEAMLITHQKAKHFKCPDCNRKLNTAQGLVIHAYQVHKRNVTTVPGAVPGRDSVEIEVFGMAGIPDGMKMGGVIDPNEQPPDPKKARLEAAGGASTATQYPQAYTPASVGYAAPMPYMPHMPPPLMGQPPYAPPPYGGYGYPGMPPHSGMPRPAMPQPMGMVPPHMPLPYMPPPGYAGVPRPPAPLPPPGVQVTQGAPHSAPQAPLFPIGPAGGPPMMPMSSSGPTTGVGALFPIAGATAAGAAQPSPVHGAEPGAPSGPVDPGLVWQDEVLSPEEKRAMLPKYAAKAPEPPVAMRPFGF